MVVARLTKTGTTLITKLTNATKAHGPRFIELAKVELRPPTPGEIAKVPEGINNLLGGLKSGKWKTTTTQEAFINSMVVLEICLLFYVGECIGKGSIVGYHIKGTYHNEFMSYME